MVDVIVYAGMKLRYFDKYSTHHEEIATVHKDSHGEWFAVWSDGVESQHGFYSGIFDNSINDKYWKIVDVASTTQPIKSFNLKEANTKPDATECATCGGKLKDPMMGPMFKYCPKCEP